MSAEFPEVGKEYTFKGQAVTVTATGKRGRPRKDGSQGGWVEYAPYAIENPARVTLTEWQRGVS